MCVQGIFLQYLQRYTVEFFWPSRACKENLVAPTNNKHTLGYLLVMRVQGMFLLCKQYSCNIYYQQTCPFKYCDHACARNILGTVTKHILEFFQIMMNILQHSLL